MRLSKLVFVLGAAVISCALVVPSASAANDPCKVLTAEKFSAVMGYVATTDKTASTKMSCFYTGPGHSGGQFTILSEAAGPQMDDAQWSRFCATTGQGHRGRLIQARGGHFFTLNQID